MEVGELKNTNEGQLEDPWVPTTPLKPNFRKPVPIYSYGADGAAACPEFAPGAGENSVPCDGSLRSATIANVTGDGGRNFAQMAAFGGGGHDMSFSELLLNMQSGSVNSALIQPRNMDGSDSLFIPPFNSQLKGDPVTDAANAGLSNHHLPLERQIIQDNDDPEGTSMQINTDEKNPRGEEENVAAASTNKELCDRVVELSSVSIVSTACKENQNPDEGSSQVVDPNKTPQQKPRRRKHRPKVIVEGKPKGTRKPDTQNSVIVEGKPKGTRKPDTQNSVIVEDKPKRTRKPATQNNLQSKENPTGKRKYVRKKGLDKISTTAVEATTELITDSAPQSAKRSCRRSLSFDKGAKDESAAARTADLDEDCVIVKVVNVGLASDPTTSIKRASNRKASLSEDPQADSSFQSRRIIEQKLKRRYARKKALKKSSAPPPEVTGKVTKEMTLVSEKLCCSSSSNFDIGARDENSASTENVTAHLSTETGVATQVSNVGLACDLNTSIEQASNNCTAAPKEAQAPSKGSSPEAQKNEKPATKKKYARKKRSNKSCAPSTEMTEELNGPSMPECNTMPGEIRVKDENCAGEENLNVCISKENTAVSEAHDQGTSMQQAPVDTEAPSASPSKGDSPGVNPKGKPTGRKTYARKKRLKNSSAPEVAGELTEPMKPVSTKMSGRMSLNYDIEARDESSKPRENSNVHISKENSVLVEETHVGAKLNVNSVKNTNRRNGQAAAQDWHENSASILLNSVAQPNPNSLVSQMVGFKRKHSGSAKWPDTSSMNMYGAQHNSLPSYQTQCWLQFPQKRRSEKGKTSYTYSMTTTKEVQLAYPQQDARAHPYASSSSFWIFGSEHYAARLPAIESVSGNTPTFDEFVLSLRRLGERPSSPAQIYGCAALSRVGNCNAEPIYTAEQLGISDRKALEDAERQLTCVDALVAETPAPLPKKKRNKKKTEMQQHPNSAPGNYNLAMVKSSDIAPEVSWKINVDALAEQFRRLNMNIDLALVRYKKEKKRKQKSIVLGDGTIVPYQGDPIKKQHPRPRVNLDEETDRVWKLLMLDINSHGIDGTDEDKAKWWDEERNVFRGRADSFIARMHLVQGDRRFSRWKGSVVDSVVGVFLTQNVSDHLSSSAFMSLAARYPPKSSSTGKTDGGEGTSLVVEGPHVHIVEPEENAEWDAKTSNQYVCDRSSMPVAIVEHSGEKEAVNSNDSCRTTSSVTSLTDESNCRLSESSQKDIREHDSSIGSGLVGAMSEAGEEKSCSEGAKNELNDIISSQGSVISSQISGDSSGDQNPEKIGSCSDSNSEVEDLSRTSFSKLLELASSSNLHEVNSQRSQSNENLRDAYCQSTDQVLNSHSQSLVAQLHPQEQSNHMQQNFNTSDHKDVVRSETNEVSSTPRKSKSKGQGNEKKEEVNWDSLRVNAQAKAGKREKTENTMDSLDWDAVRCADVGEIADIIKERGMNNRLAERIQNFLQRLVDKHGAIDLEWLRDAPPDQVKEYLLSFRGLGLKSVECVRLLTLHHLAFPVDTNVGRIAVRLGWVPLQPLPESLQLHLLEMYPILESIQKYLWPRLCKLDQRTLYELHYQMITFGKVFCTKSKPNCNACPMRGECRHFASAFASARLALPGPEQKGIVTTSGNNATDQNPSTINSQLHLLLPGDANQGAETQQTEVCGELVSKPQINSCEPIIEEPATPEPECSEYDMEDAFCEEDPCEIPTIELDMEEFTLNLQNYMQNRMELQEGEMSKALVALNPAAASIPTPKLKNVNRLRTEHCVYELPDTHPLLKGWDTRETDDPGKYLLAIWTPGETANSIQPPESKCSSSQECGQLCNEKECFSCNSYREANSQIVRGTLLIPCRTAMRGSFPLNGTYFQVNEVFADHESSLNPISVPRSWIWNLIRRTVYFGTSVTSIFKGLTTQEIQQCFWKGYVCVRGFERESRAPRPLMARLHVPASKMPKPNENTRKKSTPVKSAKSQGLEPNPPEEQPELLSNIPCAESQGLEPNPPEQQPELLSDNPSSQPSVKG